ncbi:hypothetical protein M5689_007068 [Euphorbia peplus]|nr:hypothetical protein M5689_007068 [Euphorbia peplus]
MSGFMTLLLEGNEVNLGLGDSEADDIFDVHNEYMNETANGDVDTNVNETVNVEVPISEEEMRGFNEPAADLEADLDSLKGSDDESEDHNVDFKDDAIGFQELALGMRFTYADQFYRALRAWTIYRGYAHVIKKNCTTLVQVKCDFPGCPFKVRASKIRDNMTFKITSFRPEHTCPRNFDENIVTHEFLAEKYLEDFRDDSECKITALQRKIKRELGFEVTLSMCYRARNVALKKIEGQMKEQYKRLYDYAETIKVTNHGSMVKLKTNLSLVQDDPIDNREDAANIQRLPREIVVFQYMYLRFGAQKQGYFSGLRPLICLDGCHLKSSMGGQLLSAIARDGNDNMFPLAIAVVDSECKESWSWFLQLLQDDFGTVSETRWVFMSDQQKGLVESFKALMPNVEHRFCMKHMYENMKLRFKGIEYKNLLWDAAGAGTVRLWEYYMGKLRSYDEAAYEWVMQHDPHSWARCHFSENTKCDALQNNIGESFN